MNSRIILASSSPRRIDMLRNQGIEPIILPSSAEESLPLKTTTEQAVMYLALKKALYAEKLWLKEPVDPQIPSVIIAADTIVYKNGMIGKPSDKIAAEHTLKLLRNTNHFVVTGVALINPASSKRCIFYDSTEVFFMNYSDDEIKHYINTEEPWDKAGGYAIQGTWGKYISHIIGNNDNVIGFPWEKIKKELVKNWPEITL